MKPWEKYGLKQEEGLKPWEKYAVNQPTDQIVDMKVPIGERELPYGSQEIDETRNFTEPEKKDEIFRDEKQVYNKETLDTLNQRKAEINEIRNKSFFSDFKEGFKEVFGIKDKEKPITESEKAIQPKMTKTIQKVDGKLPEEELTLEQSLEQLDKNEYSVDKIRDDLGLTELKEIEGKLNSIDTETLTTQAKVDDYNKLINSYNEVSKDIQNKNIPLIVAGRKITGTFSPETEMGRELNKEEMKYSRFGKTKPDVSTLYKAPIVMGKEFLEYLALEDWATGQIFLDKFKAMTGKGYAEHLANEYQAFHLLSAKPEKQEKELQKTIQRKEESTKRGKKWEKYWNNSLKKWENDVNLQASKSTNFGILAPEEESIGNIATTIGTQLGRQATLMGTTHLANAIGNAIIPGGGVLLGIKTMAIWETGSALKQYLEAIDTLGLEGEAKQYAINMGIEISREHGQVSGAVEYFDNMLTFMKFGKLALPLFKKALVSFGIRYAGEIGEEGLQAVSFNEFSKKFKAKLLEYPNLTDKQRTQIEALELNENAWEVMQQSMKPLFVTSLLGTGYAKLSQKKTVKNIKEAKKYNRRRVTELPQSLKNELGISLWSTDSEISDKLKGLDYQLKNEINDFYDDANRLLKAGELTEVDQSELRILRNEIIIRMNQTVTTKKEFEKMEKFISKIDDNIETEEKPKILSKEETQEFLNEQPKTEPAELKKADFAEREINTTEILTEALTKVRTHLDNGDISEAGDILGDISMGVTDNKNDFKKYFKTKNGKALKEKYEQANSEYEEAVKGLGKLDKAILEAEKKDKLEQQKEAEKVIAEEEKVEPIEKIEELEKQPTEKEIEAEKQELDSQMKLADKIGKAEKLFKEGKIKETGKILDELYKTVKGNKKYTAFFESEEGKETNERYKAIDDKYEKKLEDETKETKDEKVKEKELTDAKAKADLQEPTESKEAKESEVKQPTKPEVRKSRITGKGVEKIPYVDEFGKNIVKEKNKIKYAVNDLEKPTFITVWDGKKKIGELITSSKAISGFDDYIQIGNIEISNKYRKQGIATEIYKTLLDNLPKGKKGIVGYSPDIISKKAIPKIYKKLGGKIDEETGYFYIDKVDVKKEGEGKRKQVKYVRHGTRIDIVKSETDKAWTFIDGTRANKKGKRNHQTTELAYRKNVRARNKKRKPTGTEYIRIPKGFDMERIPYLNYILGSQSNDPDFKNLKYKLHSLYNKKSAGFDMVLEELEDEAPDLYYSTNEGDTEEFKARVFADIDKLSETDRTQEYEQLQEHITQEMVETETVKGVELKKGEKITWVDENTGNTHTGVVIAEIDKDNEFAKIQNAETKEVETKEVEDFEDINILKREGATKKEIKKKEEEFKQEKPLIKKTAKDLNLAQVETDIKNFRNTKKRGQESSFNESMLEQMMVEAYKKDGITPTTKQYYDYLKKIYGKDLPIKERKARYNTAFGEAKYREGISTEKTQILTKSEQAKTEKQINRLNTFLFGNAKPEIRFVDSIQTPEGKEALGKMQGAIMDIVRGRVDMKDTHFHEVIHFAIKEFLTTKEGKVLFDTGKSEEQIAEFAIEYAKAKAHNESLPVRGFKANVRKVVSKLIRILNRLFGHARKIDTLYDFYDSLLAGEFASRKSRLDSDIGLQPAMRRSTDTKAFTDWFGKSKVVDEKGDPLVVYHGTNKEFNIFDSSKRGTEHGYTPSNMAGFFFTDNISLSETFGSKTKSVYLKLENPKIVDAVGKGYGEYKHYLNDILESINKNIFDGVIVKNYSDAGKFATKYYVANQYIVFAPTQIKSIYNEGTFDPTDPDIRYRSLIEEKKPKLTRATVEEIKKSREKLGLKEIPLDEAKKWKPIFDKAIKNDSKRKALGVAKSIRKKPRVLTNDEFASLVLQQAELEDLIEEVENDLSKAITDKEENRYSDNLTQALNDYDKVTEALRFATREAGRALNIVKLTIKRENAQYKLAKLLRTAKIRKGKELTAEETAKIAKLSKEIEKYQKIEKRLQSEIEKLQEKMAQTDAKRTFVKTTRSIKTKRTQVKLKAERNELFSQLESLGYRMNDAIGLTYESAKIISQLAVNYFESGITDVNKIAEEIQTKIPDLSKKDVYDSLGGRIKRTKRTVESDIKRQIRDLKTQARLLGEIEDAYSGVFIKDKAPKVSDAVRKLQRKLNELKRKAESSIRDEETLIKIQLRIDNVLNNIKTGIRDAKKVKKAEPIGIQEARQELSELRRLLTATDKIADLEDQLKTGNFKVPVQIQKVIKNEDLIKAQVKLTQLRRSVRELIHDMRKRTRHERYIDIITMPRSLMATADMSGVLRQGAYLTTRHPIKSAKIFGQSFKSFFSQYKADEIDVAIRKHENQPIREKAGLFLSNLDHVKFTEKEEAFVSNLAVKIPVYGKLVKASERQMVSHLNLLRASAFDNFLNSYPDATDEELKAWARFVNIASGRGEARLLKVAGEELSIVIFAPKFSWSRIQLPFQQVLPRNLRHKNVSKEIAKNNLAFISTVGTALLLFSLAGAEIETDPEDSDFMKVKIGNTRIDLFGGMLQAIRLELRILLTALDTAGIIDRDKKTDLRGAIERFIRYKSSPTVSIPFELAEGKDVIGRERKVWQTFMNAVSPLVAEEMIETYLSNPVLGMALAPFILLGISIQTYERKKKKPKTESEQRQSDYNAIGSFRKRKRKAAKEELSGKRLEKRLDRIRKQTERKIEIFNKKYDSDKDYDEMFDDY